MDPRCKLYQPNFICQLDEIEERDCPTSRDDRLGVSDLRSVSLEDVKARRDPLDTLVTATRHKKNDYASSPGIQDLLYGHCVIIKRTIRDDTRW